ELGDPLVQLAQLLVAGGQLGGVGGGPGGGVVPVGGVAGAGAVGVLLLLLQADPEDVAAGGGQRAGDGERFGAGDGVGELLGGAVGDAAQLVGERSGAAHHGVGDLDGDVAALLLGVLFVQVGDGLRVDRGELVGLARRLLGRCLLAAAGVLPLGRRTAGGGEQEHGS